MNELNRSMGLGDAYPFELSQAVRGKLHFVHMVILNYRARSRTRPRGGAAGGARRRRALALLLVAAGRGATILRHVQEHDRPPRSPSHISERWPRCVA